MTTQIPAATITNEEASRLNEIVRNHFSESLREVKRSDNPPIFDKISTVRRYQFEGETQPTKIIFTAIRPKQDQPADGPLTNVSVDVAPVPIGYSVKRNDFYGDYIEVPKKVGKALGRSLAARPDIILSNFLRQGAGRGDQVSGQPFFSVERGNLTKGAPLTAKSLRAGIQKMTQTFGITPDTLIVPAQLYVRAAEVVKKRKCKASVDAAIRQIIRMPALSYDGSQNGNWYLASCMSDAGAAGLYFAIDERSTYQYADFNAKEIAFVVEQSMGAEYGDAAYMARFEAAA